MLLRFDRRASEERRQRLEDYRRKIRFKQVKFSIAVTAWQFVILVGSMLLLNYSPELGTKQP